MDEIDRAQEEQERSINAAMLARDKTELTDTGFCYYCSDPVKQGHFCDVDCRDDYQQLNRDNNV